MALKNSLVAAAVLISSLVPLSAFADRFEWHGRGDGDRYEDGRRHPPPLPVLGHFERRGDPRWTPGRYREVVAAPQCRYVPWDGARVCRPGHRVMEWLPGRYQRAPDRVWVNG